MALCLIGGGSVLRPDASLGSFLGQISTAFRDPATQWIVVVCSGIYFVTFNVLLHRTSGLLLWRLDCPTLWLTASLALACSAYFLNYHPGSRTTQALVLIGGATIGQGVAALVAWSESLGNRTRLHAITILLALLMVGAVIKGHDILEFQYYGERRWRGVWDNPNMFGVLMGAGVVLAVGLLTSGFLQKTKKPGLFAVLKIAFYSIAAMVTAIGLVKSYSRGAWVGAVLGLSYLALQLRSILTTPGPSVPSRRTLAEELEALDIPPKSCDAPQQSERKRLFIPLAIALASLLVLAFWSLRHVETTPVRRMFSLANANDFSWRNRIAAWEGALQMMAEKPLVGFGWNMQDRFYNCFVRSPRLAEFKAIRTNDFFTLGTTLGVLALACFGMHIGISLTDNSKLRIRNLTVESRGEKRNPELSMSLSADFIPSATFVHHLSARAICRAGAVTFLVCFWFDGIDGGLFRLATGSTFWILLELGRQT